MSTLKHGIRNWNLWPPMLPFGCQGNWKWKWRRIRHGIPFTCGHLPPIQSLPPPYCIGLARVTTHLPSSAASDKKEVPLPAELPPRSGELPPPSSSSKVFLKIRCTAGRRKRPLAAARSWLGEAVAGSGSPRAARRSRCACGVGRSGSWRRRFARGWAEQMRVGGGRSSSMAGGATAGGGEQG